MPPPAEGIASRLFLGPALRTQPDRRLVTLVREGYEAAFEEIVRRYGRPLGRYAASIVGGRSEDVLQDAFAKALPALRRDQAEIDLRPWLFRIVRNTALNDLRDNPPTPEVLAEALAGGHDPAEELEQREQLADLMRQLQALPEAQRAAIVMRELEGLGHDEIAAALGLTDGGARQAIYRARQALRDGAGMLLPLPLLRLLIDHGAEAAGAGGAIAAGAGAGGAGGAAKLGVVAVVLAGSVGAGVAVHDQRGDGQAPAVGPPRASAAPTSVPSPAPVLAATEDDAAVERRADENHDDRNRAARERPERRSRDSERRRGEGRREGPRRGRGRHGGRDRHGDRRGPGRRGHRDGPRDLGGGRHGERPEPGRDGGGFVRDGDRKPRHDDDFVDEGELRPGYRDDSGATPPDEFPEEDRSGTPEDPPREEFRDPEL